MHTEPACAHLRCGGPNHCTCRCHDTGPGPIAWTIPAALAALIILTALIRTLT